MLSMLLWSIYKIVLRLRPAGLSLLSFLFTIAVIGDLVVLPLYLAETALVRPMEWSWTAVAALLSVAIFPSVLAYIFWNRGVEQVGANVAGLFVHLMPVFGVVLAWVVLDERLAAFHVAGIALILCGIYITSRFSAVVVPVGTD
jgi:drug/metabolite transporter (DMT)-like permease